MKIIVVSYYLPPTDRIGAGVQMHMLANAYVDLGHEVSVLSPSNIKDETARYDLISVRLEGRNRIVQWAEFLRDYTYVADIIHFGGDDYLVKNHDCGVQIRTYHGSCFAEAIVAKSIRDKIRMFYLGCTELISQKRWRLTTTVSWSTNRYFFRPNIVVPNGVNLSKFVPSPDKSPNPSIMFVGTLDSRKRGRKLLEVFVEAIRPQILDAELWIVRDDTTINFDGVRVYGSVSEARLIDLYQKAWVFCLPSSYEGFGVPYIEAMACGTPVIATPNPGALEVLDNGKYGLLTDIDRLGSELVTLLSDEKRRADMAKCGLERVSAYDIHKVATMYIQLARDFAENRGVR